MERRILPSCPTQSCLWLQGLCDSVSTEVSVGGSANLSVSITSLAGTIARDGKGFAI